MRRIGIIILALLLVFGIAAGEGSKAPDYILEGYDGEDTGRTWDTNLFFSRMREKTGIRFVFRQASGYSQWKERVEKIIAGENLPDVLFKAELTPTETRRMYEAKVLINLKPYLEEHAPHLWALLQEHPEWMEAIEMPDGGIAALPAFNQLQSNDYMWINTDWLKRLGMKTPTTAEELTEVLRAFKTKDPNRNGSADEIPLTFLGMWELRFLGHAFGMVDNDYYVSVKDGQVTSSLTSDENRAFLTWLHTLWTENLLDHNGFSQTDSMRRITDDSKVIPYGMMMADIPLTVVPSGAADAYQILMPLKYNEQQVYRDLTGDVIRGTFAITTACPEPERMIEWVDLLYTEEGSLLAQYGAEGDEYAVDEKGMWSWNADATEVTNVILPDHTVATGSAVPGIALEDFQLRYADSSARQSVQMMADVKASGTLVLPYPYVVLSDADAAELARIQADLMGYAEQAMACFVTGDLEMNDANWKTFCDTVHAKGLDRAISIWQKYVK